MITEKKCVVCGIGFEVYHRRKITPRKVTCGVACSWKWHDILSKKWSQDNREKMKAWRKEYDAKRKQAVVPPGGLPA